MRGVVWHGPYDVRVAENLPLPDRSQPADAVIRVTRTAICGTDLHPYRGEIANFQPQSVMGHEFTGIVEEVGSQVHQFKRGDRVVASDVIACGQCWYCHRGWHYQCQNVSLFGYGTVVGPYVPGGQAEYVRIPYADIVLSPIPPTLQDEQALFVGDILTTGFSCAAEAHIAPGDTVAVIGCGPVGLFAIMSAYLMGAGRVLALDPDPQRRAQAEKHGALPVVPDEHVEERVREYTQGRGADSVLEAVGSDKALTTALAVVRPKGTVSIVGAHSSHAMPFPSIQAFAKEITLRFVVGDPIRTRNQLMPLLETGRIDPVSIISHRIPLQEAAQGYQLFDQRKATKVVLIP
ncbi:alcohol dehydrogenase family protein [Dictyobacter kobayashii]|uniref:Dehydrogenase n=1 Tax=Dictyobacter kobayashii TaxID=2014872 RepID=A0A402ASK9_9CHLR|nr:alcohol dehydrogenase family protein [Dictyobacter kobayashii]GCE22090.1 dehydrogenase [Dictyobacter kobayashii]